MTDITVEDAPNRIVRRSVIVDASAAEIFDLLADPRRHHEIDGSGTVRAARLSAPTRLSKGAEFGMKMNYGVPYSITNTVVDFEEDELIAWRHLGGHVWRYRLEALEDGRTRVTEEFDGRSAVFPPVLWLLRSQRNNAVAIEKTLTRLAERFDS